MAYTVKNLAALSGVSVRTLHYYDEIGLLEPAYCGANGYRFYEEEEVLRLQQILFYRELGLPLKQIQDLLARRDFDKIQALESHRKTLLQELDRKRQLLSTVEKTIEHLKGTKRMKSKEMFTGFDSEQQRQHEQYLVDRYGADMQRSITQSKRRVKDWSKEKWEQTMHEFADICQQLVKAIELGETPDSSTAQAQIRRHFQWICQFWTPNRESYAGHSHLLVDSALRNAYTAHHKALPEYVAAGIRHFAEHDLE